MRFLKRLVLLFILIVVITQLSQDNRNFITNTAKRWVNTSFCERVIHYRLGDIEKEFNISKEELQKATTEAAMLWNTQYGKEIFVQSDTGELSINLVYDGRQKMVTKINQLDSDVAAQKLKLEEQNATLDATKNKLEIEVKDLNKKIDYWNSKGGAPEEEYNKLVQKQNDLQKQIESLNASVEKINSEVDKINNTVQDLNTNVGSFNSILKINPEVGTYTSRINKIDIFFFGSHEELVHVLAHEMGHALGLAHVDQADAIMNPTISTNIKLLESDIQELTSFCTNKNRLDLIKNDIANYLYAFSSYIQKNYPNL